MNFYTRQAQARRQSKWLVVLFVLALLAVIAAVDFIVLALMTAVQTDNLALPDGTWMQAHPGTVILTSLIVVTIIGLSSLYKSMQLRGGGGVVARSLGGTRLERDSTDVLKRRLFNVVEEIAIASGVPLPEIYVLEHEEAINAFAAGHLPANAAIAVTRGALEKLNRAELQGVIAHEFGHILNGDMRLNTRLIGLIFGLLVVALIGRTVLRFGPRRSRKGGGALLLAALAVMVLGYIGVFFGRLLQAAVSRHRESLADASAVQFTRDPQGLKGALVKIGGLEAGSRLDSPEVDEVAHMLFAPGMARLFATHPPLVERIRALDPSFRESEFTKVRAEPQIAPAEAAPAASLKSQADLKDLAILPAAISQLVGHFGTEHVVAAHEMAEVLPLELLRQPGGAVAVLLALALDSRAEVRAIQTQQIQECMGSQAVEGALAMQGPISELPRNLCLPMLHEAISELRRLPGAERRKLLETLGRLILADGRIDIFEYALATLARVYLRDELQPLGPTGTVSFKHASVELQALFSTLAQHGAQNDKDAQHAYEIGMHHLLPQRRPPYNPVKGWPAALDRALKCLDRLAPAGKEQLVEALVKTISHDRRLTQNEAELLRAICASLHCPLPPLLGLAA